MATFTGLARTNYFGVKDRADFDAAIAPLGGVDGIKIVPGPDDTVALLCYGGLPRTRPITDADGDYVDDEEIEFMRLIAEHLLDDHVAILLLVGFEKMRYLVGTAEAVNNKGESVGIDLETEIMKLAEPLGRHITDPSY